MSGIKETVFRYRDKIAVAFLLIVFICMASGIGTLGIGDLAEDRLDLLGYLVIAAGHTLRFLALRHIGPKSRTHTLGAPQLVTDGPYAVVRNPLYLANWIIAIGLCLVAQLGWVLVAGPLLALLLYYVVALAEEPRLLAQFGEAYQRYCATTPRFFPRLLLRKRGWRALWGSGATHSILRSKEYQAVLGSVCCVLLFELVEHLRRAKGLA